MRISEDSFLPIEIILIAFDRAQGNKQEFKRLLEQEYDSLKLNICPKNGQVYSKNMMLR